MIASRIRSQALCLLVAIAPPILAADAYPTKPVHIIVPFAAGGPTDTQARWAAQQLSTALGQPFIVENRASAGGVPATSFVAKAAPDGYTLLAGNPGPITIAPNVRSNLGYTLKDLAPVYLIARTPSCLAVRKDLPARDFAELVTLAKDKPGGLNYGTPGIGTVGHLTFELIASRADIKLKHIPYRGAAQANTDLLGGTLDMALIQVGPCAALVKEGKVRALAITSGKRNPLLPEVPTLAESGLPGFDISNWNGVLAPAGTPVPVLEKLRDVMARQIATPEARELFKQQGYEAGEESLDAYGRFLTDETERWGEVAKKAHVHID